MVCRFDSAFAFDVNQVLKGRKLRRPVITLHAQVLSLALLVSKKPFVIDQRLCSKHWRGDFIDIASQRLSDFCAFCCSDSDAQPSELGGCATLVKIHVGDSCEWASARGKHCPYLASTIGRRPNTLANCRKY